MSRTCTGLDIQNSGTVTNFGLQLAKLYTDSGSNGFQLNSLNRLEKAKQTRERLDIPEKCPHKPYNEETDKCIFHLTEREKDRFEVSKSKVENAFIKRIKERSAGETRPKNFINTSFNQLDLRYLDIDTAGNRPIDIRFSDIDGLYLDHTVLHEQLRLDYSIINDLKVISSDLLGGLSVKEAEINSNKTQIRDSSFNEDLNLKRSVINSAKTNLKNNVFAENCVLTDCEFIIQPDKSIVGDKEENITFKGSTFYGNVRFRNINVEFSSEKSVGSQNKGNIKVTLRHCKFGGDILDLTGATFGQWSKDSLAQNRPTPDNLNEISSISFKYADFNNCDVKGNSAKFAGEFDISNSNFSQSTLDLSDCIVSGDLLLKDAKFSERVVNFAGLLVYDNFNISDSIFENNKKLIFEDIVVKSNLTCRDIILNCKRINYHDADVHGKLNFDDAQINGKNIDFSDLNILNKTSFKRASISGQQIKFNKSIFNGGVFFNNARFSGRVSFQKSRFKHKDVIFSEVDAEDANFQFIGTHTMTNDHSRNESTPIKFCKAIVPKGRFEQPPSPGTYYDFTKATVGDIQLTFHKSNNNKDKLFEYFKFYETEFDGFDFSKSEYRSELKRNGWRLDTVSVTDKDDSVSQRKFMFPISLISGINPTKSVRNKLKNYAKLIRSGSDPDANYDEMESTYRKAKIGADEQGVSGASSQFFQKELLFRRFSHGQRVWLRTSSNNRTKPTLWEKGRRAWHWIKNWVLWATSGYGERPWRVIGSSLAVIIMFAITYEITWLVSDASRPDQLQGITGSLTLSAEMFTSIIIGGTEIESGLVRYISYFEGFVGSFFIALFVVTITRSVRR